MAEIRDYVITQGYNITMKNVDAEQFLTIILHYILIWTEVWRV